MDKSWMSKNKLSKEFENGVEEFLKFANNKLGPYSTKRCPCKRCSNLYSYSSEKIRQHLFRFSIDPTYTTWIWHGEKILDEGLSSMDDDIHQDKDMDPPDHAFFTEKMVQAAQDQYIGDPEKFKELLEDAEKPLYEGSSHTKLSAVVELFNEKAKGGWSDISFSRHLKSLSKMLPKDNLLPVNMAEVKKNLSVYGIKYEKIHACPNDCILYRLQYQDEVICPTCGVSRYKKNNNKSENSPGSPAKVLWYFPPIPRFKKMFQSVQTAKDLTWHDTDREIDEYLRHPADSPAWKLVDQKWPQFGSESRNLRLALSADGVNPHRSLSSMYSCWPVMLITYNLPPWLCMKRKFIMLTMLISGPRQPGNDIDVYLAPLIEDLYTLWENGVEVFDAYQQQSFNLKVVLLWTINDFPALGNLSGCIVKGYYACPICGENTDSIRLKHSGKNVYTGTRRHLPRNHPYRRQKKVFNGEQDFREQPEPLTGEEVLENIKNIVITWGKEEFEPPTTSKRPRNRKQNDNKMAKKYRPRDTYVRDNNNPSKCWKKKSIFFDLPYWKYLLVRHNLDVMHIEKNVCDSLIGTLLEIPGKTKDGLKSRLDLKDLGIRTNLVPQIGEKRTLLPAACYKLTKDEKIRVCRTLHELKVPTGYSSNFRSLVSMQDLKLHGLKSHDSHVLMQQLLPVALRSVLPKHVRYAIMRFCFFFNAICAKVIDVSKLMDIQKDIVVTLCMLEKYFPPSFFDIMVHLTVHLVREVQLCGPVFFRWMYAFERYMMILKGYVRNRYRPEGCIAENYIAEEAIEFISDFLPGLHTVGIPSSRVNTHSDMVLLGNAPPGGKLILENSKSLDQAHHYVLRNTIDVQPYIGIHMGDITEKYPRQSRNPTWLQKEHNKTFGQWIKAKVLEERGNSTNKVSETLRWLAQGPNMHVMKYQTYSINGYHFSTKDVDKSRVNQNSGVSLVADTMEVSSEKDMNPAFSDMDFYGVIVEIWILDYSKFKVPVFKCDWVNNKNGVKTDDMGFVLVDLEKVGYKDDSFILASQAKQVFYILDQENLKWSVVLPAPVRCYREDEDDNDLIYGSIVDSTRAEKLPNIESFDLSDDPKLVDTRQDCEGTWIDS